MLKTDVLIIGAGPSGSIAAAELLNQGFDVILVEKKTFPRFVIGESLLPRCMDILKAVDLLEAVRSHGFQEKDGAKFLHENQSCDFRFAEQHTKGWEWTWQVPRADFDHVLSTEIERRGASVFYEADFLDVELSENEVKSRVRMEGEEREIQSRFLIDGSGYGRVLPRLLDLSRPSDQPSRDALFTHFTENQRDQSEDNQRIQIIVLDRELWAWIIPFSNGKTSVGFVGELNGRDFNELLNMDARLRDRFDSGEFVFEPQLISAFSISVSKFYGDRFVLTGNSTEFLDPVFSSGVTLAMESAYRAAQIIGKQLREEAVNWEEDYVGYIQNGVDVFRSYVNYWYDGTLQTIFFADDIKQTIKDQICSVLAGYVWDDSNPYVKKHATAPKALAKVIDYNY